MEIKAFVAAVRQSLSGETIRHFRYSARSLLVYLGCTPEDFGRGPSDPGYVVWLDPAWHVCSLQRVVVGSREAQARPAEGEPDRERLTGLLEPLLGKTVEAVTTDLWSNDLSLIVEGGYLVRTFAADSRAKHIWHVDDNRRRLSLHADPAGFKLVERGAAVPVDAADLAAD